MAAKIEKNGSYSFVESIANGERAWHGLGKVFDRPLTTIEALEGANANFIVSKQPICALTPEIVTAIQNGEMIDACLLNNLVINGKVATMREDRNKPLGIVNDTYEVVQNTDCFSFMDNVCTGGVNSPCIETCGLLTEGNSNVGSRIFMTAKIPEPIRLNGNSNDVVEMYLLITTSHTGKGAVNVLVTPTRVVCANTLSMAFNDCQNRWSFKHTKNVKVRMDMAQQTIANYCGYVKSFEQQTARLASIKLNDKEVEALCANVVSGNSDWRKKIVIDEISQKTKTMIDELKNSIYAGIGQDLVPTNTALHIYNGVTFHYNHVRTPKTDSKQFESLFDETGTAYKKQQLAFDMLTSGVFAA